jgi:hypothetical protein
LVFSISKLDELIFSRANPKYKNKNVGLKKKNLKLKPHTGQIMNSMKKYFTSRQIA